MLSLGVKMFALVRQTVSHQVDCRKKVLKGLDVRAHIQGRDNGSIYVSISRGLQV